jgi:pyruvate,water dikinase
MSGALVAWLDDAPADAASAMGGKFASLAEMTRAGFGVPPGFAVTADAYAAFMAAGGLLDEVRAASADLDRDDLAAVEAASARIARAIEDAPMPAEVADAIAAAYGALCERAGTETVPAAVRSSGLAEDLAGASFAGQYDTYLWICGADEVLRHVRRCWSGRFGPAVLTYRPAGGPDAAGQGMAVGVQQMVAARSAGVMFTLDPVTGDRSKIVIEGSWGLGEAVVSGEVTPDRFRLDKVTLEVLERAIATKEREYRFEAGSGVALRDVPADRRDAACLHAEDVTALAELAKRIERHRGAPQDIEWAVDERGRVHVLQVRPETVWSRRQRGPVAAAGGSAMDLVMGKFMMGVKPEPGREARA